MRQAVKWIAGAFVLLAVAVVVAGTALWRTVTPSSGQATSAGLDAPVAIVRDRHAVAHIEAETFADAAHALGFTHAQERLWQMETLRRTAGGRLAELFGEPALDFDIFLRTLGMDRAAARSLTALKPETRTILEAYAAGVNAWVNRERKRLEPALPPEFLVFGAGFEPWKPADTAAIMKIMSLQLSKNLGNELQRLDLAARGFGPGEIADLLVSHPDETAPELPDLRRLLPFRPVRDVLSADTEEIAAYPFVVPEVARWASNNWVVAGSRTVTGKPLLANDPHLAFGAPSLWYLAHMRWRDGGRTRNLIGATLPGTPLVLLGRGDRVAWGFTNAGADVQDIHIERTKAGDPTQYLTPEGWRAFETRWETILIADAEPVTIEVRETRHGPVLPDRLPVPSDAPMVFSNVLKDLYVPALGWTGLDDDTSLDVLVGLARADTTEDVIASFGSVVSPMQAIVVADADGAIALATPARVPRRALENRVRGRAPVPGWLPEYDWQGAIDARDIPVVRGGGEGAIVTANTRLPNADAVPMTLDWDETARLDRARALIVDAAGPHDMASMIAAQNDTKSELLLALRDGLLALHVPDEPYAAMLRDWDGHMNREATAPLLMIAWAKTLTEAALADDLGAAFTRFDDIDHHVLGRILQGGARDWCDDRRTPRVEACAEIVATAWNAALTDLSERFGSEPAGWNWGRAHPVRNAHQPFDKVPGLRNLFNVERPASGGPHTLNRGRTSIGKDDPYAATHGAGYKAIYDLADPERSVFIQTTGQSGNPFSRQYRAFASRWADGGYIPMVTDPGNYREGALGVWRLRPD